MKEFFDSIVILAIFLMVICLFLRMIYQEKQKRARAARTRRGTRGHHRAIHHRRSHGLVAKLWRGIF